MALNNAAYGLDTQEYGMCLNSNVNEWEIDDRIWMQKQLNKSFVPNIDLQKHQKKNHFKGVAW